MILFNLLISSLVFSQEEEVCFYTEEKYLGTELCAKEGEHVDVYRNHRELNDKFKSVKVPAILQVLVFKDDNFHGWSELIQNDTSNLGPFSDIISSFIVQHVRVCFYTLNEYKGTELCGKEGEHVDVYRNHNELNDRFQSVKVPTTMQVLVFKDDNFHGWSELIRKDTSDLGAFSNIISSFIVQSARVCFYTEQQFCGISYCASEGDKVDLKSHPEFNNNFESISIPPGLLVKAFTEEGFKGKFTSFKNDVVDLGNLNNMISSFIIGFASTPKDEL